MKRIYFFSLLLLFACGNKTIAHSSLACRDVNVSTASQLKAALEDGKPGDNIILADGTYAGNFVIPAGTNGTAQQMITISGSRKAILDGANINTGYVLHLQANYWHVKGFTIQNGLKGIMADGANYNIIDEVFIHDIGEEGLHFRKFSTHNIVQRATIKNTGLKTADYGEGIYIGSAISNWSKYTGGAEDRCDSNTITANTIGPGCAAECIDIKEGTTGNIIRSNHFDATGITGANSADSWIDVKGNYTIIENNVGFNAGGAIFTDGYQVHCAADGWGNNNSFSGNESTVNAAGYGFNIIQKSSKGNAIGNKVYSNNKVSNAAKGVANISLTQ